ncbi:N-acetyltransferase [Aurantiacibacter xanthus]|uniref:GNAT family N-acetyltransferase n=1 Tax=Aurantiacibacter xanthus TaxID=1784712 RepID=UPI0026B249D7
MSGVTLRPATPDDVESLAKLGRDSFCAAFAHLYRADNLAAFLEQAYAPAVVAGEVRDDLHRHCLAVDPASGALLGYVKIRVPSYYAEYSGATNPMALCQLYTDPARTGMGIGAMLMDWALDEARAGGHDAVQLSVWSENYGAQRFYARYGFAKIADIHFDVGDQRDEEFLFELRLDGARASSAG